MANMIRLTALQGISLFLNELEKRVPVWTGRTRRSFHSLGEKLVQEGVRNKPLKLPITPVKALSAIPTSQRGPYKSHVSLPRRGKTQFTFSFSNDTPYYGRNDTTSVTNMRLKHPTPWLSQQYGMEAYSAHVRKYLPKRVKQLTTSLFRAIFDVDVSADPKLKSNSDYVEVEGDDEGFTVKTSGGRSMKERWK